MQETIKQKALAWFEDLCDKGTVTDMYKRTGNFRMGGWGHDIGPTEEDILKMYQAENSIQGKISKSMGVNTRPSYKFEINGYWLMLDPNADEATVEQVQDLIKKSKKIKQVAQNCSNCKHKEVHATHEPCVSCGVLSYYKNFNAIKINWEAKQ